MMMKQRGGADAGDGLGRKFADLLGGEQRLPPSGRVPVGLFDRLDLAPDDGSNCGEYRILRHDSNGRLNSAEHTRLASLGFVHISEGGNLSPALGTTSTRGARVTPTCASRLQLAGERIRWPRT
jgi:hypothetical protein